ncbi:MAG: HlyD family efflux transporter periplasmic adaptor subunit [Desulfobacterales bacterium]
MSAVNNGKNLATHPKVLLRIGICLLVVAAGLGGMFALASLKKPPAEVELSERPIKVEVIEARRTDHQVMITGYGEARVISDVVISPEVSGRVTAVHPRLHVGEIVESGALLFAVDERDYRAAFNEAEASVRQLELSVQRLEQQQTIDAARLKTLERSRELARAEFDRLRRLFEDDSVGTRSGVEQAERAFNAADDQAAQLAQAVTLYPIRIQEAKSQRASAMARRSLAQANLARCRVTAPFTGRIKAVNLEKGQFAVAGQPALTLADDSVLEIQIPLDSKDARRWLRFDGAVESEGGAWFSGLTPVLCRILWTEDKEGHSWQGRLHRVVQFDQKTRTLTVAVRIEAEAAVKSRPEGLPLVEGMFCAVEIPGQRLPGVFRLPRQAVSFENTVYLAVDGRLKTASVDVVRTQGDYAYVSEGIGEGALVVTTRLVDPLENSLLEIEGRQSRGASS